MSSVLYQPLTADSEAMAPGRIPVGSYIYLIWLQESRRTEGSKPHQHAVAEIHSIYSDLDTANSIARHIYLENFAEGHDMDDRDVSDEDGYEVEEEEQERNGYVCEHQEGLISRTWDRERGKDQGKNQDRSKAGGDGSRYEEEDSDVVLFLTKLRRDGGLRFESVEGKSTKNMVWVQRMILKSWMSE